MDWRLPSSTILSTLIGGAMLTWALGLGECAEARRGVDLAVEKGHPVHLMIRVGDTVSAIHDLTAEECERAARTVEEKLPGASAWCWR